MIIGTGTDLVEIKRFEKMTPRFAARIFTKNEQERLGLDIENTSSEAPANSSSKSFAILPPHLQATAAGLFAAKEAVAKALGTGFRTFFPCEIEIIKDKYGVPRVLLHAAAKKAARPRRNTRPRIHITITHTNTHALAFAVIST
jgi:holo-[acyl-carrier protein] synthase